MKCPISIVGLAEAIFNQTGPMDGAAFDLARVQRDRIVGIHIVRHYAWTEGFVDGPPNHTWLYDSVGLNTIATPTLQEYYDSVSSPFPRLAYAKVGDRTYGLNYRCGSRAARGYVVTERFQNGRLILVPKQGCTAWIS